MDTTDEQVQILRDRIANHLGVCLGGYPPPPQILRVSYELADTIIGWLGFTWDDVDMLRSVTPTREGFAGADEDAAQLAELADRIAALLPPREP